MNHNPSRLICNSADLSKNFHTNYFRIFDHETSLHTVLAANCKYMSESFYYYKKEGYTL